MRTCTLITDNAIVDSIKDRWVISDTGRTALKIWPKLYKRCTMSLFKLQRGALSVIVGVITGHCIMGTHARRIDLGHLANDFCRSCRDVEGMGREGGYPSLAGYIPGFFQRGRKYLLNYYIDNLKELSRIDIGSLNRFIRSSEWSLRLGNSG